MVHVLQLMDPDWHIIIAQGSVTLGFSLGTGRSVGFDRHIRTCDYHYPVGIAKISVSLSTQWGWTACRLNKGHVVHFWLLTASSIATVFWGTFIWNTNTLGPFSVIPVTNCPESLLPISQSLAILLANCLCLRSERHLRPFLLFQGKKDSEMWCFMFFSTCGERLLPTTVLWGHPE